ncbi:MAG: P-loop NTPase fold protein [Butyrivibrio hungatei]|nr:P-loop NTPase fold protein [Butyrivibrio hungatei]
MGNNATETMRKYNVEEIKKEISGLRTARKQKESKRDGIRDKLQEDYEAMEKQYEQYEHLDAVPPIESYPEYQLNSLKSDVEDLKMRENFYQDIVDLIAEGDDYNRIYSNKIFTGTIKSHDGFVEKDLLNRRMAAQDVADKILRENIKSTAIFGKWGTGKTAFLKFISEGLESKAKSSNRKIETITIDASAYSDQNQIWAYIYERVREKFSSSFFNRVKYVFAFHRKLFVAIILPFLFLHIVVPLIVKIPYLQQIDISFESFEKYYDVITQFIDFAAFLGFVIGFISLVFKGCFFAAKKALSYTIPRYSDSLGVKLRIREDLNKIVKVWNKDIYFMVDELDRSNDNTILDFFDAIQLFQNDRIHLIYAIDQDVLYKALGNEKGFTDSDTNSFLRKYIDYSYLLKGINKDSKALNELICSYNFTKNEKIFIEMALFKLDVSLSIREVIHILNILNQIKEDWLKKEVFTSKYMLDGEKVLNFRKFIPWAIYYYTESEWTRNIEQDFVFKNEDFTLSLGCYISHLKDEELKKEYKDCPDYFKDSIINNIIIYMEWIAKYQFI